MNKSSARSSGNKIKVNTDLGQTIVIVLICLALYHQLLGCSKSSHLIEAEYNQPEKEQTNKHTHTNNRNPSSSGIERRMTKYYETYHYKKPDYDFQKASDVMCGTGPDFEEFFKLDQFQRSRKDEDKIIYELFFKNRMQQQQDSSVGTYVELGAYDGVQESNTRFFDTCLGWKGLLMEGNPGNFAKTVENRPGAHRMQVAPSCSAEYEAVNKTITFAKAPSTNSGLKGFTGVFDHGRPLVEVPCGPLGPILDDIFGENGNRITFFSLDVEGAELLVMNTLDFSKVHIDVMMIEVFNSNCQRNCEKRTMIRKIMQNAGFKGYENVVYASDVYVHPNSPYQLDEDAAPPKIQALW